MQPLGCSLSSSLFPLTSAERFRCGCIAVLYYTLYEHTRGIDRAYNTRAQCLGCLAQMAALRCAGLAGCTHRSSRRYASACTISLR